MEYLEILSYTVTDNQMNDFEAEIACEYYGKHLQVKIKSPWHRDDIFPHTIEILNDNSFDEYQKESFRKAVSVYLKKNIIE